MSFGWSAGDIVSAITLLVRVSQALKDTGGASSDYQDTSLFLECLGATLERIRTCGKLRFDDERLRSLRAEVEAVRIAVTSFKNIIHDRFERALGPGNHKGWKRIFDDPRKIQYSLFISKEVRKLQDKISTPLKSIQMNLGIDILNTVTDLRAVVDTLPEEIILQVERTVTSILERKYDEDFIMKEQKLLREIGEWLGPIPTVDDFCTFSSTLHPGTCEWIFEAPGFAQWMAGNAATPNLFWINAIPGAGKSYLATRIIQKLEAIHPVAYFYCDSKNEQKRSALNILRTWVWQLLQQTPDSLTPIATQYYRGANPSVAGMVEALLLLSQNNIAIGNQCRIVLDGLDECEQPAREEIFRVLPVILNYSRVLLVSRYENDISQRIKRTTGKEFLSLQITESDNREDILNYTQYAVISMDLDDDSLHQKILESLKRGTRGMFLWTRLMIDELSIPGRSIEEYEDALNNLPDGLDELYGRILDNLDANSKLRERSKQLFQWLVCAARPLTLGELKHALAIEIDSEQSKPKKMIPNLEATIRQCCGSLVNIDSGDHTVKLIHASAKEFLLSTHSYSPSYASLLVDASFANTYIARSCLTYLCFSDIGLVDANEDQESSLNKLRAHLNSWQFLEYASVNWSLHLDPTSPQGISSFRRLYSSDWNTVKWIELVVGLGSSSWAHTSGREYSIIHTLKSFQLSANLASDNNYERWLIHLDGPPDGRQSRWRQFIDVKLPSECLPILHISAFFDFVTFTQSLIEKGTSVNQRCYLGRTTLHQAARSDAVSTAKMLVQAKANINARDDRGATPLIYAVDPGANLGGRTGPFLVGSLLLDAGADVCAITVSPLTTALTLACYTPRPDDEHVLKLVTSLLDHGATKIINIGDNRTPLVEAAKNSSYKLLRTLLHYGASVDIGHGKDHNDTIGTPLIQLCDMEDSAIMCILLDAGANIHARDFDGRTCLHKTARLKSPHASKLLLEHGADVNAIASSDGSLPIHDAVRENCTEQIELLLKHKTKLEAEDGIGRTPLDIAVENKSVEAAQMLLKAGANPNRRHTYIGIKNEQLQVKGHERVYQPQTSHDLFHVYHMLVRGLRTPLPHGIAISIIKLAEYFLKTQSTRSEYNCIVERNAGQPYLRSGPITGNVQMIAFTIESHDQGFSSYPQDRGTYNNSWAWFEVGVVNMMGMEVPIGGQKRIQNNVHASRKKRRHVVVYGKGKHMNNAEWLQSLSQGDTVMVVPFARYNGWENHVYSVKIEIYTVNLRD